MEAGATTLETLLVEVNAAARSRWPGFDLPVDVFLPYLAERLKPGAEGLEGALRAVNASDLYLACGCAEGVPAALEAFDAAFLGDIDATVTSLRAPGALADEVKQLVRMKLFVAEPGARPRIGDYAGHGDLRTWFRVVAVRTLLSLLRKGQREIALADEEIFDLVAQVDDPGLALLKRRFRAELKTAFEEAVRSLGARPRNLLRQQLLDGLTIDDLGRLYRVHRVTAARWVKAAREQVGAETRRQLVERTGLSGDDLDQMIADIRSQLDLSLERVLASSRRGI